MKSNYWCNGQQSKAQPNMWRPLKRWMLKTKSISTYHCKVLVCHLGIREGVKSFRPGQQGRQSMCNMQRKKKHTRDKIWTQNSQSLSSYNTPIALLRVQIEQQHNTKLTFLSPLSLATSSPEQWVARLSWWPQIKNVKVIHKDICKMLQPIIMQNRKKERRADN